VTVEGPGRGDMSVDAAEVVVHNASAKPTNVIATP
jgi:hypothetical protein